jgi:sugar phosphate isomerase/epimerase
MHAFRLGATSYIIPDGLLENARFLGGKVQDMELVLFDLDEGPSNLPSPETTARLAAHARENGLSYTVHLPVDLCFTSGAGLDHPSILKARKAIAGTLELQPWAYLVHLDGREVRLGEENQLLRRWQDRTARGLEALAAWAGDPALLAVENLETYPPDFVQPVVERLPASRCVDVGHLWLDGHDPLPHLQAAHPRLRVIHLHGAAGRDHVSLAHMPPEQVKPVIDWINHSGFSGVVTLEVFGEEDFWSSLGAISILLNS